MDFRKQKLKELKGIQQELSSQLELIKQNIQQLEKEIDEQNCPIMSRINEHRKNIIVGEQKRKRVKITRRKMVQQNEIKYPDYTIFYIFCIKYMIIFAIKIFFPH